MSDKDWTIYFSGHRVDSPVEDDFTAESFAHSFPDNLYAMVANSSFSQHPAPEDYVLDKLEVLIKESMS